MENLVEQIAGRLTEVIGVDAKHLSRARLMQLLRVRLEKRNVSPTNYLALLESDRAEWQEILEETVVLESWFFRDVMPFACLRWFVRQVYPTRPLRILSIPCATGEEPYSLAILLLDAGIKPDDFHIDALDLSARALQIARTARYGRRSFREIDPMIQTMQESYLVAEGDNYRVPARIAQQVTFAQANLLAPTSLGKLPQSYDVIFCRNLLIYLTDTAWRRVLQTLHSLLKPGGLLYLGHTEGRAAASPLLRPLGSQFPFAFTRADSAPTAPAFAVSPSLFEPTAAVPVVPAPIETMPRVAWTMPTTPAQPTLETARLAADSGRLSEAEQLCENFIRQQPTAEVFCLLGTVKHAQRLFDQAERIFHQALYMDSGCQEALIHLMLLAERKGDANASAHYRRRAGLAASGDPT